MRAVLIIVLTGLATFSWAANTEKAKPDVSGQIQRLADPAARQLAVANLTRLGKDAVPVLTEALGNANDGVRTGAAEALRNIFAADPSAATNAHDKAYWEERVGKVTVGMSLDEAKKILFPDLTPGELRKREGGGMGSGNSASMMYRLDDYWTVTIWYQNFAKPAIHAAPVLSKSVKYVWVGAPGDFTGTWHAFFVNGQPSHVIEYRAGKYHGTFTTYSPEGNRNMEQHYVDGVAHGTDTGFHGDGTPSYQGVYNHGKQVGTWRWFDENGKVTNTQTFEGKE